MSLMFQKVVLSCRYNSFILINTLIRNIAHPAPDLISYCMAHLTGILHSQPNRFSFLSYVAYYLLCKRNLPHLWNIATSKGLGSEKEVTSCNCRKLLFDFHIELTSLSFVSIYLTSMLCIKLYWITMRSLALMPQATKQGSPLPSPTNYKFMDNIFFKSVHVYMKDSECVETNKNLFSNF